MTYDLFAEIAELRAELAHSLLTRRERRDAMRRLATLTAQAAAQEEEA
ncbi:hypothetical protein [Aureimonas ureilytica]|nr:hypothetical protein [Aureimonas ureilytica]